MDYKQIEQMLERYWRCETSLEEEVQLRDWFLREDVPAHLVRYKVWFVYQDQQQNIHLDEDFDRKVLDQIEVAVVKAHRVSVWSRLVPLMKAAAVIAVMLSLGTVMRHTLLTDEVDVIMPDTIGRQITSPSVAFSVENVEEDSQQALDSLKQIEYPEKSIKR